MVTATKNYSQNIRSPKYYCLGSNLPSKFKVIIYRKTSEKKLFCLTVVVDLSLIVAHHLEVEWISCC